MKMVESQITTHRRHTSPKTSSPDKATGTQSALLSPTVIRATFYHLFNAMTDAIVIQNQDGLILEANGSACEFFNKKREQLLGSPLHDLFPPDHRENLRLSRQAVLMHNTHTHQSRLVDQTGKRRPVEVYLVLIHVAGVEALLVRIREIVDDSTNDVSPRTTAMLQAVNDLAIELATANPLMDLSRLICGRLRELTNAIWTSAGVYNEKKKCLKLQNIASEGWVWATMNRLARRKLMDLEIPISSEIYKRLTSIPAERFDGCYGITLASIPKTVCHMVDKVLGIGYAYGIAITFEGKLAGACTIVMPTSAPPLPMEMLKTFGNVVAASFQRTEAQAKLSAYEKKLRSLGSEVSLAEERERRRIANALHDDVTQTLALVDIKLGMFAEQVSNRSDFDEICRLVGHCIQKTRTLTFELSPPILYELGLEAALEWLAEQTSTRHGISCRFHTDRKRRSLDKQLQVLLFQATRELLVNVWKHAAASTVTVSISDDGKLLTLSVHDNGRGIVPHEQPHDDKKQGGFGLFSIRERLTYLGGVLNVTSSPGKGTMAAMVLPLASS